MDSPTPKEKGLIKHLSRRNYQLEETKEELNTAIEIALKMLHSCGGDVYEYAKEMKMCGKAYGMSHIGDYVNKKGHTSKAHYNPNNTYIGSVNRKGNKPVKCLYWSPINIDKFRYDEKKNCFVPIPIE